MKTCMRLPTRYPCASGRIKISGLFGFAVTPGNSYNTILANMVWKSLESLHYHDHNEIADFLQQWGRPTAFGCQSCTGTCPSPLPSPKVRLWWWWWWRWWWWWWCRLLTIVTNIFPCCISHFYYLLALRPLWSLLDVGGDGCSPLGDGEHSWSADARLADLHQSSPRQGQDPLATWVIVIRMVVTIQPARQVHSGSSLEGQTLRLLPSAAPPILIHDHLVFKNHPFLTFNSP